MEGNSLVTQVDNPALIKDLEYSDEEIESYLDLSKILEILIHGTEEDKQKVARNLPGLFPEDKPAILGLKKKIWEKCADSENSETKRIFYERVYLGDIDGEIQDFKISILKNSAKDEDPYIRRLVADKLTDITLSPSYVQLDTLIKCSEILIDLMDDENKDVRRLAKKYLPGLSYFKDNVDFGKKLFQKALDDPDSEIVMYVINNIGDLFNDDSEEVACAKLDIYLQTLANPEPLIKTTVIKLLPAIFESDSENIVAKKTNLWQASLKEEGFGAEDYLYRIYSVREQSPKTLKVIIGMFSVISEGGDAQLIRNFLRKISTFQASDTPGMVFAREGAIQKALSNSDEIIRREVATTLPTLEDEDSRYTILVKERLWRKIIDDESPSVKKRVLQRFNNDAEKELSNSLVINSNAGLYKKILEDDSYYPDSLVLLQKIGKIDNPALKETILKYQEKAIKDDNLDIRHATASYLPLLKDGDPDLARKINIWRLAVSDSHPMVYATALIKFSDIQVNQAKGEIFDFYNEIFNKFLTLNSETLPLIKALDSLPEITGKEDPELLSHKLKIWKSIEILKDANNPRILESIAMRLPALKDSDSEKTLETKYTLWAETINALPDILYSAAPYLPNFFGNESDSLFNKKIQLCKIFLNTKDPTLCLPLAVNFNNFYTEPSPGQYNELLSLYDELSNIENEKLLVELLTGFPRTNQFDDFELSQKKLTLFTRITEKVRPEVLRYASKSIPEIFDHDSIEVQQQKLMLFNKILAVSNGINLAEKVPVITGKESPESYSIKIKAWSSLLAKPNSDIAEKIFEKLPQLSPDDSPEEFDKKLDLFRLIAAESSTSYNWRFRLRVLQTLVNSDAFRDEQKKPLIMPLLFYSLLDSDGDVMNLARRHIPEDLGGVNSNLESFCRLFDIDTNLPDIRKHLSSKPGTRQYFRSIMIQSSQEKAIFLSKEDLLKPHSNLMELVIEKKLGIDFSKDTDESKFQELAKEYISTVDSWKLDSYRLENFNKFCEIFGYKRTLLFLKRPLLDKGTAVNSIDSLKRIMDHSGLTVDQFWGNILSQVARDDSRYGESCAQIHLEEMTTSFSVNFESIISEAQQYHIPEMVELASIFSQKEKIFESWNSFKRYFDLVTLLGNKETLNTLEVLESENPALANYVKTLFFHKDSQVSTSAIKMFLENIAGFMSQDDNDAPPEVHATKKPIRFFNIPNLDSNPIEMRSALVEGYFDRIQGFPPFKMVYRIPKDLMSAEILYMNDEEIIESVKEVLKLGRSSKEARDMFKKLSGIMSREQIKSFVDGSYALSPKQTELVRKNYEETQTTGDFLDIEVEIHPKSSPVAAIAGDDMANCMKFGDGKNTVYMFNTNTGLMTVRVKVGSRWRTIASSLLTRDTEIESGLMTGETSKETALAFRKSLSEKGGRLDLAVPESVLEVEKNPIPFCDNIEMAASFMQKKWQLLVKSLYSDFWSAYLTENSHTFSETKSLMVGMGYNDLGYEANGVKVDFFDSKEQNRWVPMAMVSYTDALGSEVGVISLKDSLKKYRTKQEKPVIKKTIHTPISDLGRRNGVRYASPDDSLAVGWLESHIYHESGAGFFVEGPATMENMLIATQINNEVKGRPQMTLVHESEINGRRKVDGYLMGYEGVLGYSGAEMSPYSGKPVLYIEDMAVREEAKIGGGAMLLEFIDLYKTNYLEKGKLVPIFMQARESTSFELVLKKVRKIADRLNIDIKMVGDTEKSGDSNYRHTILLVPQTRNS